MAKKILAVYFTQSGQTKAILESFLHPLIFDGNQVEFLQIQTVKDFPFPWPTPAFFDTVPESVDGIPTRLQPWQTQQSKYDLVVLGWQPWNLSPSIPFNSILQDEQFKSIISNTPVITICGCRNMWINAQEKNKKLLQTAGAKLVGNIALMDRHPNHISFFTILHWMGTGKKTRKWGIFPLPGVANKDIEAASKFGNLVNACISTMNFDGMQQEIVKAGGAPVKYSLMFIERTACKIFQKWVNIINKHPQNRKQILIAYKYYLSVALLIASPVILTVDLLLFRPFMQKKIKRMMDYYRSVAYLEKI